MKNDLHQHTIVYMDDDQDDLQLLREAMDRFDGDYQLLDAADGIEGLELLQRLKAGHELPCLIVLDINMPRMDGRRTFQQIRKDPALAHIPIVIFSTSNSELDKLFFRGKNVEYITKPVHFNSLVEVAERMLQTCHEAKVQVHR
ncbi:response regulator [Flaviaesturariibacter flavus]|uniref:Response regulator n=1 Tax=Flaviaesturariibacter flavus TaxID=2502780 RepID=A0A4R1BBH6_9BACT|nr:response regulator [Flaviaesturariibacter flavus]TCJ14324.1 response regulator [Flaviaesturariibacter flavus]